MTNRTTTSSTRRRPHGFSLIEVMVATVIVAFIGAAALNLMTVSADQNAKGRMRSLVAADAQTVLQRLIGMAGTARAHGGTARFCELLVATESPFSSGTASGTCPELTVTGAVVSGTNFSRAIAITAQALNGVSGLAVRLSVSSVTGSVSHVDTFIPEI